MPCHVLKLFGEAIVVFSTILIIVLSFDSTMTLSLLINRVNLAGAHDANNNEA